MEKYRDIEEIKKVIEQLKILDDLKPYCKDDPFAPWESEVTRLQTDVTGMLNSYIELLRDLDAGNLRFDTDGKNITQEHTCGGKNAPARKNNIDAIQIYKLYLDGVSIRKIAKQMGCSPDTVKRRIVEVEQEMKDGW